MEGLSNIVDSLPGSLPYVFYMWHENRLLVYKRFTTKPEPFMSRFLYWLGLKNLIEQEQKQWLAKLRALLKDPRSFVHNKVDDADIPDPEDAFQTVSRLEDYISDAFPESPWLLVRETRSSHYHLKGQPVVAECNNCFVAFMWLVLEGLDKNVREAHFLSDAFLVGELGEDVRLNELRPLVVRWMRGDDTVSFVLQNEEEESEGLAAALREAQ